MDAIISPSGAAATSGEQSSGPIRPKVDAVVQDDRPPDSNLPDSPQGAPAEFVSNEELDSLLEKASALADDLCAQVGVPDEPLGESRLERTTVESKLPEQLQKELEHLDQTIAAAHDVLGGDGEGIGGAIPQAAPRETPPRRTAPPVQTYEMPDFMAEFTRQTESDAAREQANTGSLASEAPPPNSEARITERQAGGPGSFGPPKPGVVGPGMIGVIGPQRKSRADESPATPGSGDPNSSVVPWASEEPVARRLLAPLSWAVSLGTAFTHHVVALLERMDGPLSRLSQPVRTVIGWIALATLGTSLLVYVVSLF